MGDQLREDIEERGEVRPRDGEDAMNAIIAMIRTLQADGEIEFRSQDSEED